MRPPLCLRKMIHFPTPMTIFNIIEHVLFVGTDRSIVDNNKLLKDGSRDGRNKNRIRSGIKIILILKLELI